MGLKFRKRIRFGSLLFWNISLSKKGAKTSLSAGKPGLNFNIGDVGGKLRLRKYTVGIPGSGIRYDKTFEHRNKDSEHQKKHGESQGKRFMHFVKMLVVAFVVFSILYVIFD